MTLAAAASVTIRVLFQPQATGVRRGTVRIEQQDFFLQGEGADAFPQPGIFLDLPSPHSAQQGTLSIVLPSPSPVSGEGTVTLVFHPAVAGVVADPGVMFLSTSTGSVIFTVTQGESSGKFTGGAQDTSFQTGTTAGDILFTAQLPGWQAQATVTIASASIGLGSTQALRTPAGLDVKIDGFDNTRTASQFTFTFFDGGGRAVTPGALNVDLTTDFKAFYDRSQMGGVFGLRAVFPVTGDASLIDAVSIALTNAAGTTPVDRLKFTAQ